MCCELVLIMQVGSRSYAPLPSVWSPKVGQLIQNRATGEYSRVLHVDPDYVHTEYLKRFEALGEVRYITDNRGPIRRPLARTLRYLKPAA